LAKTDPRSLFATVKLFVHTVTFRNVLDNKVLTVYKYRYTGKSYVENKVTDFLLGHACGFPSQDLFLKKAISFTR